MYKPTNLSNCTISNARSEDIDVSCVKVSEEIVQRCRSHTMFEQILVDRNNALKMKTSSLKAKWYVASKSKDNS